MKTMIPTGGAAASVTLGQADQPRLRPDEALIKVEAYSVNRGETFQLENPKANWRPGKDIAGLVVQAAPDGSGPTVGRRVVGHPPMGGWAEYAAVPTTSLTELPDNVPSVMAAALPLAGITALRLLRTVGTVAGKRILLTGASGGVGHYVVELAAGAGAEITAVTGSAERGRRLLELGASNVIHDVSEATAPYDVVLESTGGENLPRALAVLARRGTLIWFGQASREPVTLDFFSFFDGPESATLRHFHYADSEVTYGEDLSTLVRLVAAGRLHPEIGLVTDWTATADVLSQLRGRRIRGNAILTVS